MAKQGYTISVAVVDNASPQLNKINSSMQRMQKTSEQSNKQGVVNSVNDNKRYKTLNKAMDDFGKGVKANLGSVNKLFDEITKSVSGTIDALGGVAKMGLTVLGTGGLLAAGLLATLGLV